MVLHALQSSDHKWGKLVATNNATDGHDQMKGKFRRWDRPHVQELSKEVTRRSVMIVGLEITGKGKTIKSNKNKNKKRAL